MPWSSSSCEEATKSSPVYLLLYVSTTPVLGQATPAFHRDGYPSSQRDYTLLPIGLISYVAGRSILRHWRDQLFHLQNMLCVISSQTDLGVIFT